jgi:hypothetical protein
MTGPSADIVPFRIGIPGAVAADLRDRLRWVRWPEPKDGQ